MQKFIQEVKDNLLAHKIAAKVRKMNNGTVMVKYNQKVFFLKPNAAIYSQESIERMITAISCDNYLS